jgi:glutamate dehydrogenase (NAD(P)+)
MNCAVGPHNIDMIKAKIIIELANGPICHLTEEDILKRDITVVPDVLANAGGVVGSFFEWRNNKIGMKENEDALVKELEGIMLQAYSDVKATAEKYKTSLRNGAYILGSMRILEKEKERDHL